MSFEECLRARSLAIAGWEPRESAQSRTSFEELLREFEGRLASHIDRTGRRQHELTAQVLSQQQQMLNLLESERKQPVHFDAAADAHVRSGEAVLAHCGDLALEPLQDTSSPEIRPNVVDTSPGSPSGAVASPCFDGSVSKQQSESPSSVTGHTPETWGLATVRGTLRVQWLRSLRKKRLDGTSGDAHNIQMLRLLDRLSALLILMNSVFLGVQVQHSANNREAHSAVEITSYIFCVAFTLELMLRIGLRGTEFCKGAERAWNLLDSVVVIAMLLDRLTMVWLRSSTVFSRLALLRTLRMLRLVRAFNVIRVLKYFHEFQLLIKAIGAASHTCLFVVVLLAVMVYIAGIVLTEGALDHCRSDTAGRSARVESLCAQFGTLDRSILSLYEAICGGALWGKLLDATQPMSFVYSGILIVFSTFAVIAVMNIVTGIFIGIANKVANRDWDTATLDQIQQMAFFDKSIHRLFGLIDTNNSGSISLDKLKLAMREERVVAFLTALGLKTQDTQALFLALARQGRHAIDVEDFILSCRKAHGNARQIDLLSLQSKVESLTRRLMNNAELSMDLEPRLATSGRMHPQGGVRFEQLPVACVPTSRGSVGASRIAKPEERAMSIKELSGLRALIKRLCVEDLWVDPRTGQKLQPSGVNLYHFNYHYMSPATVQGVVLLRGLEGEGYVEGQVFRQADPDRQWLRPQAEGLVKQVSASGDVEVTVKCGRFVGAVEAGGRAGIIEALGGEVHGELQTVEAPCAISYKELVSSRPSRPTWFCSHWWGENVLDFVRCCEEHALHRQLIGDEANYWVCAYANCQHNLAEDIGVVDPENSSFRKAMHLAEGVLLILDRRATPFKRIWCDYELYTTLSDSSKKLDIVTVKTGTPRLLSDGLLPDESAYSKIVREEGFPIAVLVRGLSACLEEGEATMAADRERILHSMAGEAAGAHGVGGSALEVALRRANNTLHARFALAAWPQAVKSKLVEDFDLQRPGSLSLQAILRQDTERECLELSLSHCMEVVDHDLDVLAGGLVTNLSNLRLNFEGCTNITDVGVKALSCQFPATLKILELSFLGCRQVTDSGLESLASYLPSGLLELRLDFASLPHITAQGLHILAGTLPMTLTRFSAIFRGTSVNRSFNSPLELHSFCRAAGSL